MKISYFINQYPKVSHSFIRREIIALENQGINIQRIALRGWDADLVDKRDAKEREITEYILNRGYFSILTEVLKTILFNFMAFCKALRIMLKISKNSNRKFVLHLISIIEAIYVKKLTAEHDSKHIHAHFGTNSAEIVLYCKLLGGPNYSFTVHGPEEFDKPEQLHLKEKIKYSKFVVAITSYCRSQLYRWSEYEDWDKIKIVHCGVEKDFYNNSDVALPSYNKFVCVGRLCEQKGQLLLIEACKILKDEGLEFHLTLAGDGEMRSACESLIKEYKLQQCVAISGWISSDEVRKLILTSKSMLLPSFAEGLPVVIMESMFLKRPVLTTYIAGIPELIQNNYNGFLIPSGSIDRIALKLKEIMVASPESLIEISQRAYNAVSENHNIETESKKLRNLIYD